MSEQSIVVRGETFVLPIVATTSSGTYVVMDNRAVRLPVSDRGDYLVAHARTGQLLPILNSRWHNRRSRLAYAQKIEDLGAFDAITGLLVSDPAIRAEAVAVSKGWGL